MARGREVLFLRAGLAGVSRAGMIGGAGRSRRRAGGRPTPRFAMPRRLLLRSQRSKGAA